MIRISDEVREAEAVVALETTIVAHGFPQGEGMSVGLESERRVRAAGAVPALVGWTAPASDGGSPITGYVVTPYIGASPQTPTTFNSPTPMPTASSVPTSAIHLFSTRLRSSAAMISMRTKSKTLTVNGTRCRT